MKKMLKVSSKGQITLPKAVRTQINLQTGKFVVIENVTNDSFTVKRVKDTEEFVGAFKDIFPQDAVAYQRELRDREYGDDCV